jgi:hypothetical protein
MGSNQSKKQSLISSLFKGSPQRGMGSNQSKKQSLISSLFKGSPQRGMGSNQSKKQSLISSLFKGSPQRGMGSNQQTQKKKNNSIILSSITLFPIDFLQFYPFRRREALRQLQLYLLKLRQLR